MRKTFRCRWAIGNASDMARSSGEPESDGWTAVAAEDTRPKIDALGAVREHCTCAFTLVGETSQDGPGAVHPLRRCSGLVEAGAGCG